MTRAIVIAAACLVLAGCGGAPVDTGSLAPPAKWLMAKPCKLPAYPPNDGDPVVRADYDTQMRRCAARRGDQVRGLQKYARTVAKQ